MKLQVNETRRAWIHAPEPWNDTGITMVAGQRYRLVATGRWIDLLIKTDANGFTTDETPWIGRWLMRRHEKNRRRPHDNWFALIGAIGRDETTTFRIGTELTFVADRDGELTCFANDAPKAYGNNRGKIELAVTRLA